MNSTFAESGILDSRRRGCLLRCAGSDYLSPPSKYEPNEWNDCFFGRTFPARPGPVRCRRPPKTTPNCGFEQVNNCGIIFFSQARNQCFFNNLCFDACSPWNSWRSTQKLNKFRSLITGNKVFPPQQLYLKFIFTLQARPLTAPLTTASASTRTPGSGARCPSWRRRGATRPRWWRRQGSGSSREGSTGEYVHKLKQVNIIFIYFY